MIRSTIAGCLLLPLITSAGKAQVANAVDVGSGVSRLGPTGAWTRDTRVGSVLRLDRGPTVLFADVEVFEREGVLTLRRSAVDGAVSLPLAGAARFSLGGRVVAGGDGRDEPLVNLGGSLVNAGLAAVSFTRGVSGMWIGASVTERSAGGANAGFWRTIGGAVVTLSGTNRASASRAGIVHRTVQVWDSVWTDTTGWNYYRRDQVIADSTNASRRRVSELEARIDWAVRNVQLTAMVGGRGRVDSLRSAVWGRLNAAVQVAPRLAIVAAAGSAPAVPNTPSRMSRFALLGLRVTPTRAPRPPLPAPVRPATTSFAATPLPTGQYQLVLRVPGARTVDISGDFTGWKPIALRELSAGTWEVTLPLSAGTHRVNVRVNGEGWTAPPGLPAIDDEFNGRVGLLIIP